MKADKTHIRHFTINVELTGADVHSAPACQQQTIPLKVQLKFILLEAEQNKIDLNHP